MWTYYPSSRALTHYCPPLRAVGVEGVKILTFVKRPDLPRARVGVGRKFRAWRQVLKHRVGIPRSFGH